MEKSEVGNIVLTLKVGQRVQVGDDIQMQVMKVGGHGTGSATKIRISAPKEKKIFRIKDERASKP